LDGLSSPKQIAKRCKEIGCKSCAITDHGTVSGFVDFGKACKRYDIKPIYGCEVYTSKLDQTIKSNENKSHNHLTLLAKNQDGVRDLMNLVSYSNHPDNFYRKPRISVENLSLFTKNRNLLCLSGCIIGELSSSLFEDIGKACLVGEQTDDISEVKKLLKPNWKNISDEIVSKYIKIFGKENYFIEIQEEGMPAQKVVVECLREVAKSLDIRSACTLDAHYAKKEQVDDHRILLYSQLHTTQDQQEKLKSEGSDTMSFFFRDTFYIFSPEEMKEHYTTKEMETTLEISDMIKPISFGRKPCLPKYSNKDSNELIKELCIKGAKEKLSNSAKDKKEIYWQRLQNELSVIKEAKLADYFLIVYDICKFIDENNAPRGIGRGSGAGCLVNYLLSITKVDPIEYNLYFQRFYNAGRNVKPHFNIGHLDFSAWLSDENYDKETRSITELREKILSYIYKKIGNQQRYVQEEIAWIDENNKLMWLYIYDIVKSHNAENKGNEPFNNKDNSHIAYFLVKNCELNKNKNTNVNEGHISLPDIDLDISVTFREKVIEYLIQKYGEDKVSQIVTFGRLQGRAALKEVFRAQPELVKHLIKVRAVKEGKDLEEVDINSLDLCNEITNFIPNEAEIIDEINQIREDTEDEDYSILRWSLDHQEQIKEYYKHFKPLFDQAIRIEGTKKSQGKHAAGTVIADIPISNLVPMVYDSSNKTRMVGLEMNDAEKMGCTKFDLLGLVVLDKIRMSENLINGVKC